MGAVRPYASWGRSGPMLHGGDPALCFMGVARPYASWGWPGPMLHGGGPCPCPMLVLELAPPHTGQLLC